MECGGSTPLCYGEARLASEQQRLSLLRALLHFIFFEIPNLKFEIRLSAPATSSPAR
jgi:hypothetical protein